MAAGKEAVVLFDRVAWVEDEVRHEASKGEKVSLPADEFARLEGLKAVAAPRSKDAKAAAEEAEAESEG